MSETTFERPTWAEINLDNLAFNFNSVKSFIHENINYMAVVKADAYGHGAVRCAKRLETEGIDWFGVALPEEGLELRENGVKKPILCLGSFWAGQENLLLANDLTPVIFNLGIAERLDRAAKEKGIRANIHVKIDTGMGRLGVRFDKVNEFAERLTAFQNLNVEAIMTHFAAADDLDDNFTELQTERFNDAVKIFEAKGFGPKFKDLANSPGAIAHENSRADMVRIGGVLYGLGDDVLPHEIDLPQLKPVLSLHTKISHLKKVPAGETLGYGRTFETKKDSLIATVPIGYQDGYSRVLSNCGRTLVRGAEAPVVGRVSMDWTIIDVTGVPGVGLGDEVILIGNSGNLSITAEELAKKTGTLSYEITCGISSRVIKKYIG